MDHDIAARVRTIIVESGKTQREVADEIGIDGPKLTKSLTGVRQFSTYELAALAELGGRTVEWILTGEQPRQLSFARRSTLIGPGATHNPGREYASIIVDRYRDARELGFIAGPQSLPNVPSRSSYIAQADALAATAAVRVEHPLRHLGWRGLIDEVERAFDIHVAVEELADGIDGMSLADGDTRLIVVEPTDRTGRQRFTLAHELGHVLFGDGGREVIEERLFDSKTKEETRADVFAASFLMPKSEVLDLLAGRNAEDCFFELVWAFRVSPVSMGWRLLNLKLITDEQRLMLSDKALSRVARSLDRLQEHRQRIEESLSTRAAARLADAYIGAYLAGEVGTAPVADVSGLSVATIERLLEEVAYPDRWPNPSSDE